MVFYLFAAHCAKLFDRPYLDVFFKIRNHPQEMAANRNRLCYIARQDCIIGNRRVSDQRGGKL
jgi:hypothetical protein